MEDFLFILIAIGWLLYSFFHGKKKRSQQYEQLDESEEYNQEDQPTSEQEESSFFESLFAEDTDIDTREPAPYQPYSKRVHETDYTPLSGNEQYLDKGEPKKPAMEKASDASDVRFIPLDADTIGGNDEFFEGESVLEDELADYESGEEGAREAIGFDLRK
ncbi:MAG: hypothetical protein K9I94_14220, partial [Bacteroidales bacterium]|nr:hypothetical protein [Bacteroidales bacterium]